MKVLTQGRPQQGWSVEADCLGSGNGGGGCGATLLVEEADVFQTSSYHYDGSSEHYATFRCGACGVLTDLPSKVRVPFDLPSQRAWESRRARAKTRVSINLGSGKTVKVERDQLPRILKQVQALWEEIQSQQVPE